MAETKPEAQPEAQAEGMEGMDPKEFISDKFADLYPERSGKIAQVPGDFWNTLRPYFYYGLERGTIINDCQFSVIKCFEKNPQAKLMWSALNSRGCNLDLARHFSCEYCKIPKGFNRKGNLYDIQDKGTFDDENNQVNI